MTIPPATESDWLYKLAESYALAESDPEGPGWSNDVMLMIRRCAALEIERDNLRAELLAARFGNLPRTVEAQSSNPTV